MHLDSFRLNNLFLLYFFNNNETNVKSSSSKITISFVCIIRESFIVVFLSIVFQMNVVFCDIIHHS